MKRAITAPIKLILSATLAVSLLVVPASAGNNHSRSNDGEFATVIGALIGLAALGAILSNKKDDRGHYTPPPSPRRPVVQPRYVPEHLQLPPQCKKKFHTQISQKHFYPRKCLKKHFAYTSQIPRACLKSVVIRNRKGIWVNRKMYDPNCLWTRGYRRTATY